jgi:hypothetical protein
MTLETISLLVGIMGIGISIYQMAVINERKKKLGELQYLLAGIHSSAVQKQIAWLNQLALVPKSENERDKESFRIHVRARDDFAALAGLALALEGAINTGVSAINTMNERTLEQAKRINLVQEEGRKNPEPLAGS